MRARLSSAVTLRTLDHHINDAGTVHAIMDALRPHLPDLEHAPYEGNPDARAEA
jgi:hypothetical protein